jgi:hypothetical protein
VVKLSRYLCFLEVFIVGHSGLKAQNVINTDRPDQSDGTHIVEKKYFQIETGLQFSKLDKFTKGFDNVTLIRYGISRRFEIRLLNQYSMTSDSVRTSGIKPLAISFKNQLCTQHGLLPKITLVSYFRLPVTISPAFRGDHFGYTFTLAARHDLSSKMKIYSNLGITQDQESTDISYLGTLELNYNFTEQFCAYVEYFGNYAAHEEASNGADIGFIYALKRNFAIDIAFGSPTFRLGINRFISCGMSVHLPNQSVKK